jgi:hypothetical protein
MISISTFIKNHVAKKIDSGKSDTIFEFQIPKGYIGFIYKIACSYYQNTFIDFIVDGFVERIEREIPINSPEEIDPPIVVKNFIKAVGYNNDTIDHFFEFYIDGYLYELKR